MSALRLYLVRHGETEWNGARRYQGQTDTPLNSRGHSQAEAVAHRLADAGLDVVHSSDLQRASATAGPIAAAAGVALELEPALRELSFGAFEGKTAIEIQASMPDAGNAWWSDTLRARPPGGETLAELDTRVRSWWTGVSRTTSARHVGIVAHGGSLNRLIGVLLDLPLESYWRLRLLNASVTTIEVGPRRTELLQYNDVCHLVGLP